MNCVGTLIKCRFRSTALVTDKEWHIVHCASDKPRQDFSLVELVQLGHHNVNTVPNSLTGLVPFSGCTPLVTLPLDSAVIVKSNTVEVLIYAVNDHRKYFWDLIM